jgi:hypothetical protein
MGDDGLTPVERHHRRAMEYEEDEDNVPIDIHRVVHTLSVPNQSTLRSSDGSVRQIVIKKTLLRADTVP